MSVLIKDMEKPKSCGKCPLCAQTVRWGGLAYECMITGEWVDEGYE